MDLGSLSQLLPASGFKIPGIDLQNANYLLAALAGLAGLRMLAPLLSSASRIPTSLAYMGAYAMPRYRRSPALDGGFVAGLFTLGSWVSAACALVLLLSPRSLAHPFFQWEGLGPVLLFFAIGAVLLTALRCGGMALRLGFWVGVCAVLYIGFGVEAPNFENIVPRAPSVAAAQPSNATVNYRIKGDMQEFMVVQPGLTHVSLRRS